MDEPPNSILSYTIYAAGFIVGTLSPEEWLVLLSIVAVLIRLPIDIIRAYKTIKAILEKTPKIEEPPNDDST